MGDLNKKEWGLSDLRVLLNWAPLIYTMFLLAYKLYYKMYCYGTFHIFFQIFCAFFSGLRKQFSIWYSFCPHCRLCTNNTQSTLGDVPKGTINKKPPPTVKIRLKAKFFS